MNQKTYNKIEIISKWIVLPFGWGCWGGAILFKKWLLIPIGILPYILFYNIFIRGYLYSKIK